MERLHKRDKVKTNQAEYTILRILGTDGKQEIYLVTDGNDMLQMKIIHTDQKEHAAESLILHKKEVYEQIKNCGINMPALVDADPEKGIIIREYEEGTPACTLILKGVLTVHELDQVREMAVKAESHGICLDYFPTNFIIREGVVYYTKYEGYPYEEKKSFDHLVKKYWMNTAELLGVK